MIDWLFLVLCHFGNLSAIYGRGHSSNSSVYNSIIFNNYYKIILFCFIFSNAALIASFCRDPICIELYKRIFGLQILISYSNQNYMYTYYMICSFFHFLWKSWLKEGWNKDRTYSYSLRIKICNILRHKFFCANFKVFNISSYFTMSSKSTRWVTCKYLIYLSWVLIDTIWAKKNKVRQGN